MNNRIQPRPEGGFGVFRPGLGARGGRAGGPDAASGDGRLVESQSRLENAFQRLRTLLAFDGDRGPRQGVKSRGFYLNIIV